MELHNPYKGMKVVQSELGLNYLTTFKNITYTWDVSDIHKVLLN